MNLISANLVWRFAILSANGATTFAITDTKVYILMVTLSTQDNVKQELKSGIKWTINWNKYQSKVTTQIENQYLDYLIDPSFQGVNMLIYDFKIIASGQHTQVIFFQNWRWNNTMLCSMEENFLVSQQKRIKEHMITSEKL